MLSGQPPQAGLGMHRPVLGLQTIGATHAPPQFAEITHWPQVGELNPVSQTSPAGQLWPPQVVSQMHSPHMELAGLASQMYPACVQPPWQEVSHWHWPVDGLHCWMGWLQ